MTQFFRPMTDLEKQPDSEGEVLHDIMGKQLSKSELKKIKDKAKLEELYFLFGNENREILLESNDPTSEETIKKLICRECFRKESSKGSIKNKKEIFKEYQGRMILKEILVWNLKRTRGTGGESWCKDVSFRFICNHCHIKQSIVLEQEFLKKDVYKKLQSISTIMKSPRLTLNKKEKGG